MSRAVMLIRCMIVPMLRSSVVLWLRDAAYSLIAVQDRIVSRWLGRRQVAAKRLDELRKVVDDADRLGRDFKRAMGDPKFSGWDDLRRRNDELWHRIGDLNPRITKPPTS